MSVMASSYESNAMEKCYRRAARRNLQTALIWDQGEVDFAFFSPGRRAMLPLTQA
jgi:hypothetical protein